MGIGGCRSGDCGVMWVLNGLSMRSPSEASHVLSESGCARRWPGTFKQELYKDCMNSSNILTIQCLWARFDIILVVLVVFQARLVIKSSKVCGWDLGQLRILSGSVRPPRAAALCCALLRFTSCRGETLQLWRQSETVYGPCTCRKSWYIVLQFVLHFHTFLDHHYRVMLCNMAYARKLNWPFDPVGFERSLPPSQVHAGWCEHSECSECSSSKRDRSFAHLVSLCTDFHSQICGFECRLRSMNKVTLVNAWDCYCGSNSSLA